MLTEYCAVDPDYDSHVFRPVSQEYRRNTANDADALHVVTQVVVTAHAKDGPGCASHGFSTAVRPALLDFNRRHILSPYIS